MENITSYIPFSVFLVA